MRQRNVHRIAEHRTWFMIAFMLFLLVPGALAQRPVQMFDPFYRGESAVRSFYERTAVAAELSYRPPGLLQADATPSGTVSNIGVDPIGLNIRFEYKLNARFDAGMFVDATGNGAGRALDLSWIMLKYFKHQEGTDYAIRLAIDPSSDGRSGFPQADLAFLYTAPMSATVTSDFGIGIRRVQIGFQELVPSTPVPVQPGDPMVSAPGAANEVLRGRARGWEVHVSWSHNILFDPAGSNLFFALLAEGGTYDMVEWIVDQDAKQNNRRVTDYKGGVIWIRSGLKIERPSYQFTPFLAIPFRQWAPSEGEWPRARVRLGLSFMLR